jgi:hypothetical protein
MQMCNLYVKSTKILYRQFKNNINKIIYSKKVWNLILFLLDLSQFPKLNKKYDFRTESGRV